MNKTSYQDSIYNSNSIKIKSIKSIFNNPSINTGNNSIKINLKNKNDGMKLSTNTKKSRSNVLSESLSNCKIIKESKDTVNKNQSNIKEKINESKFNKFS